MKTTQITFLLLSIILFACTPKNSDEKPRSVLSDAQKQMLENAKKTEEVIEKANQERMKQVD